MKKILFFITVKEYNITTLYYKEAESYHKALFQLDYDFNLKINLDKLVPRGASRLENVDHVINFCELTKSTDILARVKSVTIL